MNKSFCKARRLIGALLFLTLFVFLAVAIQTVQAATPVYVDPDPGCHGNEPCFSAIQAAVDAVDAGGTVNVAAGTYVETIKISQPLTLIGASGAVIKPDNNTPPYDGARRAAIYVNVVDNVTIQGFEIDGTGGDVHYGIYFFNSNNSTAKNNIIHDMTNSIPPPIYDVGGMGIIIYGWDHGIDGALVQDNTIYNTGQSGIDIGGQNSSTLNYIVSNNNTINHNTVYNTWQDPTNRDGGAVEIDCAKNSIIDNNTIHDSLKLGIMVAGSSTSNRITGNEVYNTFSAIKISSDVTSCEWEGNSEAAPEVHTNILHNNLNYGLWNIDTDPAFLIDAGNNWWGAVSGPGPVGIGQGEKISANVDYTPWCTVTDCTRLSSVLISPYSPPNLTTWTNNFSWTGSVGATKYRVNIERVSPSKTTITNSLYTVGAAVGLVHCDGALNCTLSPTSSASLINGNYRWRIQDYGSYGYGAWTDYMSFTLNVPICYSLTTSVKPLKSGTVTVFPVPNCPKVGEVTKYLAGTSVSLTAVPGEGYSFSSWSGNARGSDNPITLVMSGNKSVTANMRRIVIQFFNRR